MVFGDRAPPSPKWWASWVYVAVFGVLGVVLTYGSAVYGPPLDRAGSTDEGWTVVVFVWVIVVVMLVDAVVATVRRLRSPRP